MHTMQESHMIQKKNEDTKDDSNSLKIDYITTNSDIGPKVRLNSTNHNTLICTFKTNNDQIPLDYRHNESTILFKPLINNLFTNKYYIMIRYLCVISLPNFTNQFEHGYFYTTSCAGFW